MHWWNDILLSGGRDGFIRSSTDHFYKVGKVINKIQGTNRSILAKSTNDLMEIDFKSKGKIIKSQTLTKDFSILEYYDKILIGTKN